MCPIGTPFICYQLVKEVGCFNTNLLHNKQTNNIGSPTVHIFNWTYMLGSARESIYIYIYIYINTCIYIYIYIYMCVCVCVCVCKHVDASIILQPNDNMINLFYTAESLSIIFLKQHVSINYKIQTLYNKNFRWKFSWLLCQVINSLFYSRVNTYIYS